MLFIEFIFNISEDHRSFSNTTLAKKDNFEGIISSSSYAGHFWLSEISNKTKTTQALVQIVNVIVASILLNMNFNLLPWQEPKQSTPLFWMKTWLMMTSHVTRKTLITCKNPYLLVFSFNLRFFTEFCW